MRTTAKERKQFMRECSEAFQSMGSGYGSDLTFFAVNLCGDVEDIIYFLKEVSRGHNARGSDGPCDCNICRFLEYD